MAGSIQPAKPDAAPQRPASLGERIREARLRRGMSRAELAGTEFTVSFLSLVERDKRKLSLGLLEVIARRLEVPVTYLLTGLQAGESVHLALDRAEALVYGRRAAEALRLLDTVEEPAAAQVRAVLIRGRALLELDRTEDAIPVLEGAARLARERGEFSPIAHSHFELARALADRQYFEEAAIVGRQALEAALVEPVDGAVTCKVLFLLAQIEHGRGNLTQRQEYIERAMTHLAATTNLTTRANFHLAISEAHEAAGELDTAVRSVHQAVGLLSTANDMCFVVRDLAGAAQLLVRGGEFVRARDTLELARAYSSMAVQPTIRAALEAAAAEIELAVGDIPAAEAHAREALDLVPAGGDAGASDALVVLAQVAERSGRQDEADMLMVRALDVLRRARNRHRFTEVADLYSYILEARGDVMGALRYARLAAAPEGTSGMPPE